MNCHTSTFSFICSDMAYSYQNLYFLAQKKKSKGKQPNLTIDKSYLACQHHIAMVTGIGMVQNDKFEELLGMY